jgi:polysaccharide biosynthesis transport protein
MELDRHVQLLRARWVLVAVVALGCVAASALYVAIRDPVYEAQLQLFVSTSVSSSEATPSEIYQGGLFAESRVASYARVVSSPPVAEAIAEDQDLDRNPDEVQSAISATPRDGTVLIDVTVEDSSARVAKQIADGVAREFPPFVNELEARPGTAESPVKISVTSPARLPTSSASLPGWLYLFAGLLVGLALGTAIALAWEQTRVRVGY